MSAIGDLLDTAADYPKSDGTVGFGFTRNQMIALLGECTPALESISVVPTFTDGDLTSFVITTYVSFARSDFGEVSS